MIDIEALADEARGAITTIGWAMFNPREIVRFGTTHVDAQTCFDVGAIANWQTLQWWLRQDEATRMQVQTGDEAVSIQDALVGLHRLWKEASEQGQSKVWAYPASFDLAAIHTSARMAKVDNPWPMRLSYCSKPIIKASGIDRLPKTNQHIASQDAIRQAKELILANAALGGVIL